MKFLPYRLKYDFYGLPLLIALFAVVEIVAISYFFSTNNAEKCYDSLFLLFDFILPIFFSMFVLLIFGRDLSRESHSFVFSLPISICKLILIRYLRLIVLFLCVCIPLILACQLNLEQSVMDTFVNESSLPLFFRLSPNIIGLGGISLLLLVLFRSPFLPSIIIFGGLIFDFCTFGKILAQFSLLVNYYKEVHNVNQYLFNRAFYTAVGIIAVLLSWMVVKLFSRGLFCVKSNLDI